jgi:hypothetical protein
LSKSKRQKLKTIRPTKSETLYSHLLDLSRFI